MAFLAVLTGVLLNNTRLNDVKELLRSEIKAYRWQRQPRENLSIGRVFQWARTDDTGFKSALSS